MGKTPYFVPSRPLSRADELRQQLDELEAKIGRLGYGLGDEALSIPVLFDQIAATLDAFHAEGQSMRAEEARLKTVSAKYRQKAKVFLREIGGIGRLQNARRLNQPASSSWWWFLDRLEAERRQARLWRALRLALVVFAVLALLIVLYQRFLAPDPATLERLNREQTAENLVVEGDIAGALDEIERALAVAPGDPGLLVFQGVLQQVLGQETAAEASFAAAEAAFDDPRSFLLSRGRAYLLLEQNQAALADAEALIELNPESAAGFLLLGRAYEVIEDYPSAVVAYDQASTLAEAQGDFRLAGTARVSLAVLMQRIQLSPGE